MAKKLKKVMSLVLAVAMLITSVNLGMISVKADYDATGGLNVYFKYTGEDKNVWSVAAINTWDTKDVTSINGSTLNTIPVKKWSDESTLPQMEVTDGWFSAKVTGAALKGIQFVYPINDETNPTTIELVDAANFALLPSSSEAIYYVYDGKKLTAYSDEACTQVLDSSINLHFVNTMNWDIVKLNYWGNTSSAVPIKSEIKADENGWYSVNLVPDNTENAGIQFYPDDWNRVYLLQQCLDIPGKDFWIVPFEEGNQKGYNILSVPTKITIGGTLEVSVNNTTKLSATANEGGYNEVAWESSDEKIATVDAKTGDVTGVSEGTVTITAKSVADSSILDTKEVVVKPIQVSSITIAPETVSIKKKQSTTLEVSVEPDAASEKTVKWSSSNEEIATVNATTAPTVETKEGYTFARDKEFSAVKSDLVVNAVWTAKTYTVTFMNGTEVAKTETVAHGKSATAPELTKAGYVLSWDKVFTNITGDLTVTAKWTEVKENQLVVKFVSDGQVVDTQAIDAGSAAKAPELTKEGYSLSWDKAFDKITEDTTITAVWTVKTYTVTFKDGDDILKTESVEYGKGATAPEVKAKEGYTFTWDKAFADIKADTVVSVNWTANKYTVTFKDGERTLKTEEVEYGKSATAPEVEVKEGYSFEWNKAFAEIKEDTEVSVVWTINKYYVTFSDEDVVLKTEEVEYGKSATAPKITVKEGYTFAWDKEFTAIKGDTDVKVIWTANKYTVTFKDGNEVLKTEEVEYGKSATAPTVTAKEGYTYSWDKDIVEIKGNTEVNVVWTINKYTVTFKDGDKVLKAEEVEYGKAATAPELPTKTGYTAKWDIDFTNIKETTDVNVDWVINKYIVTFMNGKEEAAKVEVEYGKSATAPKVTKKGYSLTWDKAFDKVTKDITVTAVWTANKYKLTYDANGGKATSKSKQVTFGSKIGSFPTATRKGYVLKGWYSKKTGGTELTSTSKYATAGNATIYAQWTKVSVGATKVSKVKQVSKKSFQLTLKKVSGVKGYEVVYSTNKSFKSSKTVATNKTSVKVAKLNKATTYYVKARAYKTDSTGAKVYSSYSKVVKVTTKK